MAGASNRYRNHPKYVSPEHIKEECSVHAEAAVLRKAGARARGGTLYVARLSKRGVATISKPCDRCWELIVEAGVYKVVYTI